MREALSPFALRVAGEQAIQVVAVLRVHIHAALVETGAVEERDHEEDAANVLRVGGATETDRRLDARVLGGVDPGGDEHGRTGDPSGDRDIRPRVLRETLIAREREEPAGTVASGRHRDRT